MGGVTDRRSDDHDYSCEWKFEITWQITIVQNLPLSFKKAEI